MIFRRLVYVSSMLFQKRDDLKRRARNTLETIGDLSPEYLSRHNIKLLALDFDGVLSHHGSIKPVDSAIVWLKNLATTFPLTNVCIYSNNLFPERVEYIKSIFPSIQIVYFKKKKPYPDDLIEFVQSRKLTPEVVLVVDDRITAGILSACIIGAKSLFIKNPTVDYHAKTLKECFYAVVRLIERLVLQF